MYVHRQGEDWKTYHQINVPELPGNDGTKLDKACNVDHIMQISAVICDRKSKAIAIRIKQNETHVQMTSLQKNELRIKLYTSTIIMFAYKNHRKIPNLAILKGSLCTL